ncbi:MAG TPA: TRAP transporter small permease [Desulfosporosinus sp.]|nr:TRAP transporter small permease [Desulfosporosinus sp.]
MLKVITKNLRNIDQIISGVFLGLLIIIVVVNVFLRYFVGTIFNWGEELATIFFIWSVYIGAAYCYREDRHIGIDMIYNMFPKPLQKILDILTDITLITLNGGITYLGVILSINSDGKTSFILKLPYWVIDASIVVGFGLMTIYGVIKLISRFKKANSENGNETVLYTDTM